MATAMEHVEDRFACEYLRRRAFFDTIGASCTIIPCTIPIQLPCTRNEQQNNQQQRLFISHDYGCVVCNHAQKSTRSADG